MQIWNGSRLRKLTGLPRPILISKGPLPKKAAEDAVHIAVAVVNGLDYLITWNCKHIANAKMRDKIERVCRAKGYEPVIICTPEELLED
ncbi:MAG: hypothetical protein M3495_21635 [Pseudomonadota bacterium]|nr:hypothetical protein [Pseudomonadota bacterium]